VLWFTIGGFALAGVIVGGYALLRPPAQSSAPAAASPRGSGTADSNNTYGTLPSWLPKAPIPVGRVVQASTEHPWVGIEGDTVVVHMNGHHVNAVLVGPAVPEEGDFPIPKTTASTFTLTLSGATGSIPIVPSHFLIFDEEGHRYLPQITSLDRGPAPTVVRPGHPVTLRLFNYLPPGAGEVVWTADGKRPVVSFEYVTEID